MTGRYMQQEITAGVDTVQPKSTLCFAKASRLRHIHTMQHLTIRIDLPGIGSIGPGKIRLLELIGETGSIRQAGIKLKMSYARAWGLVRELNDMLGHPVVEAAAGGKSGGGARLTTTGGKIVKLYRAVERKSETASHKDILTLRALATQRARQK